MEIQDKAKEIILEGLEERFVFLDRSLNSDLNDIQENYISKCPSQKPIEETALLV
jgi:hypothetical protein